MVEHEELSIIAEKMPPNMAEDIHYHQHAKQFFYILAGQATMRFSEHEEVLNPGDGIEIAPLEAHQMTNISCGDIEFIVVSMPKSHGDKVVIK